jgi:predicted transcriptional regulator
MQREILVKLPVELVDRLDRRARECGAPRSALIRAAVEQLVAHTAGEDIDSQIDAGSPRQPQDDTWGDASVRSMIREEPW